MFLKQWKVYVVRLSLSLEKYGGMKTQDPNIFLKDFLMNIEVLIAHAQWIIA
jgi:hypothetical protein